MAAGSLPLLPQDSIVTHQNTGPGIADLEEEFASVSVGRGVVDPLSEAPPVNLPEV
jgi:hypothetical protein